MSEIKSSTDMFDPDVYYSLEMIKEMMPYFDDIMYLVIYKEVNVNFLDEEDVHAVNKEIERYKKSRDHVTKKNLALFDASAGIISVK